MLRVALLSMVGLSLLAGRPALAQGPPFKDNIKKLEAEIEKLRNQVQDLEARLKKSSAEMGGPDRRGPGFGGGFGGAFPGKKGDGPPFGKKDEGKKEEGKKGPGDWDAAKKEFAKKFLEKKGFEGKDFKGPAFAKKGEGKGPWGEGPPWAMAGKGPRGDGPAWSRGPDGRGESERTRTEDIDRRLDRILREIEDLRRDLRRR